MEICYANPWAVPEQRLHHSSSMGSKQLQMKDDREGDQRKEKREIKATIEQDSCDNTRQVALANDGMRRKVTSKSFKHSLSIFFFAHGWNSIHCLVTQ